MKEVNEVETRTFVKTALSLYSVFLAIAFLIVGFVFLAFLLLFYQYVNVLVTFQSADKTFRHERNKPQIFYSISYHCRNGLHQQ